MPHVTILSCNAGIGRPYECKKMKAVHVLQRASSMQRLSAD